MSKILEEAVELEQKDAVEAGRVFTEPAAHFETGRASTESAAPLESPLPTLEYEEIPPPKTETAVHVKRVRKKSRKGGLAVLVALAVVAGTGVAAYRSGVLERAGFDGAGVKNSTESPEGAKAPAFVPIDPADFSVPADDNFVIVPDETGLALPSFGHGPQVSAEPQNYHIQTPNVSGFFTRAAQDESYVYFLQGPPSGQYGLYNLMRANTATGKAESVSNANEVSNSIYSFTLYGQNIITCEHKAAAGTFAFYRVPKSGEDAQLLFETDSPAYMNVFDNKIFMLFVEERTLGVFDPAADVQPSHIILDSLPETAHYFPQFSVINGYLYYGVWHDANDGESTDEDTDDASGDTQGYTEYLRRSLYTGETVTLLRGASGGAIWNPCWDAEGNAYYAQYDSSAMEFSLAAVKNGGEPQVISTFDYDGEWPSATFKDEFLVTALPNEGLRQYGRDDFSVKLAVPVESQPFAATTDFLVCDDGVYRLFDFGFVAFG